MKQIIEFKNVCKRFGKIEVLHDINLTIDTGEVVVVIGPSGSGKSTMIRCINGLEMISSGELIIDSIRLPQDHNKMQQIRLEVGMVFQQFNLFPHMTALENISFGPKKARGMSKSQANEIARDLLNKVGLSNFENQMPGQLSGGQQQRVAIARALAVSPKVMLFDEPTSALDPELKEEVLTVMKEVAKEGMTMVVVTHEMGFAADVGNRLLFMEDGRIDDEGDPVEMIKNPHSQRLKNFLVHVNN